MGIPGFAGYPGPPGEKGDKGSEGKNGHPGEKGDRVITALLFGRSAAVYSFEIPNRTSTTIFKSILFMIGPSVKLLPARHGVYWLDVTP